MLAIILIAAGLAAAFVALALVSEGFAYEVSRVAEAAFEAVEVRMERRARRRAEMCALDSANAEVVGVRLAARGASPRADAFAGYARAAGVTGPLLLRVTGPLRAA